MPKIDGINKIDSEDVKKSRKIVLSEIRKHINDPEPAVEPVKNTNSVDGIKGKVAPSPIKKTNNSLKPESEGEKKEEAKEENKKKPASQGISSVKKPKANPVPEPEKEDLKVKKVSKEKREAWLRDMGGIIKPGSDKKKEVKEGDYKIKKVFRNQGEENKPVAKSGDKAKIDKEKLLGSFFSKKKKTETVLEPVKKKEINFVSNESKTKLKEDEKRLKSKEKNNQVKKENEKEQEKTKDFEFDLTPALSQKRHEEVKEKKKKEDSFIQRMIFNFKEKKRKKQKEKAQLEERKKRTQELEKKEQEKKLKESQEKKKTAVRKKKDELAQKEEEKKQEEKRKEMIKQKEKESQEKEKKRHRKKEQRKIEREQKIKEAKKQTVQFFLNFKSFLKGGFSFLPVLTLMLFSTALFCYLLLFTLLVKFDFDNAFFRKATNYFPVPVIVSGNGIVEYYKYKDLKEEFFTNKENSVIPDFKIFLIKKMIVADLATQYNINTEGLSDDEVFKEIEKKIIFDTNINQVAINRIRKISQLIQEGADFMKTASRYGDAQGNITIEAGGENKFSKFKTDLPSLKEGELSRVEYAPDGYYIFQSIKNDGKKTDLNYVYIKSRNLNEFIKDEIVMYRMWSFVD